MKHLLVAGLLAAIGILSATKTPAQTADSTGNWLNYPGGTRVYSDGAIQTPSGDRIIPAAIIPHGDGSTTYYYSNGTHITVDQNSINSTGSPLRPSSLNGGFSQDSLNRPQPSPLRGDWHEE